MSTDPSTDLVTTTGKTGTLHHRPTCKRIRPEAVVGSPADHLDGKACSFCSAAKALAAFRVEQVAAQARTAEHAKAKGPGAKVEKAPAPRKGGLPESHLTPAGGVVVSLPSSIVRHHVEQVVASLPAGSCSAVEKDGGPLYVPLGEEAAVVQAITDHMRAIIKVDRSGNMYAEGKLRQVRSAILAVHPDAAPSRPTRETKAKKGEQRVNDLMEAMRAAKVAKAAAKRKAS